MGKRLTKALQALLLVLLITVGCLAFMPWKMSDVIPDLDTTQRGMILRYENGQYTSAYPKQEQLEALATAMADTTGSFDRKRSQAAYDPECPLYRVYLWNARGKLPEIVVCGTAFYYDGSQYVLRDEDAVRLNSQLASCFSR